LFYLQPNNIKNNRPLLADIFSQLMQVLLYAKDNNNARFCNSQSGPAFTGSTDFFDYLKDTFDSALK